MQEQPLKYFDPESSRIKERIIERNRLAFSFLTHMPIVPGHSLICPLRVVDSSEQLTFEEWQGFNFAWNMGENAGQTVPHFHLHVVPRKEGDTGIFQYEPCTL